MRLNRVPRVVAHELREPELRTRPAQLDASVTVGQRVRSALFDAIHIYFQGEKIEALMFILPIGLMSLVFSAWLLTDNPSSFAKGVAIPFLLMGLLMSSVGGVAGYLTPSQVSGVVKSLEIDPQAGVHAESMRMTKINNAWHLYLAIWDLFAVIGLRLRFATSSDFYQGLGIALIFFAGVGLLVDGFAQRRTHPYVDALHSSPLSPETYQ